MTEEQILKAIADACADNTLRFQIIIQDNVLYVYINRPADAKLDYQSLETRICTAIKAVKSLNFQEIALYSRVLGEVEPDWQSLPEDTAKIDSGQLSAMMEAITDAVEATNSIVAKIERELLIPESLATNSVDDFEELPTTADDNNSQLDTEILDSIDRAVWRQDLKQYCFIRNQRLLYAVLSPPKENIARLIDMFHLFGEPMQRSQVHIIERYFDDSTMPNLDDFEPEVQSWWTAIVMFDSDQKRQFAIWLSRYCIHPEQTMRTIEEVLQPPTTTTEEDFDLAIAESQKSQDDEQLNNRNRFGLIIGLKTMLRKFWSDRQSDRTK